MTRNTILTLIIAAILFTLIPGCGFTNQKGRIERTLREYVGATLSDDESFGFVGLTNRRDTIFMGTSHPCAGAIYTVTDLSTGEETRLFADVIFSTDYKEVLSFTPIDFDPIDHVREKIKTKFREKLRRKLGHADTGIFLFLFVLLAFSDDLLELLGPRW